MICTPGLICFLLLAAFWLIGCSNRAVLNYDEYSYWATQVRSLFLADGLTHGARNCTLRHAAYTPGMQLIEWWFMHLRGTWHEGTLYAAAFLVNSSFLLPLAERISWKRWWLIVPFSVGCIAVPTMLTGDAYSFLGVDTTLGLIFGWILYTLWSSPDERGTPFILAVQLTALVLCKQTGVIWVVLGLLFFWEILRPQQNRRLLAAAAVPFAVLGVWSLFCALSGLGSTHLSTLGQGDSQLWQNVFSVWRGMIKILLVRPFSMSGAWGGTRPLTGLPAVGWTIIFCLLAWYAEKKQGGSHPFRYAIRIGCLFAVYTVILAVSMPTVFAPEVYRWARNRQYLLEVVDRYMIPAFFGVAYLIAGMLTRTPLPNRKSLPCFALCTLLALFVNWQTVLCLTPAGYASRFPVDNGTEQLRSQLTWYQQLDNPADSRLLTTDAMTSSFDYALVPLSLVRISLSEDDPDPAHAVRAFAEEHSATHLLVMEAESVTLRMLQQAFQYEILPNTLYRIDLPALSLDPL